MNSWLPVSAMHLAAGAAGVALEPPQQIDHLAGVVAAIEDVAGLDQDGAAAAPAIAGVDQARGPQNRDELIVGAVDVADGDDALGRGDLAGRGGCRLRARVGRPARQEEQSAGKHP